MNWQLVHSLTQNPLTANPLKTNFIFNTKELIIEAKLVTALGSQQDWYRAGFVSPVFSFPDTGFVNGKKQDIALKRQYLKISDTSFPYQIEIYFHDWINSISLRFWERINLPVVPELPGGEYDVNFIVTIGE